MSSIKPYLELVRLPNLLTAVADIWAGFAVSGSVIYLRIWNEPAIDLLEPFNLILLTLTTIFLYGGGIALNDVYDAAIDARERPERVIPRQAITLRSAKNIGYSMLCIGIIFGLTVNFWSGAIALLVAICAVVYNRWGKRFLLTGPVNMGLCRAGNLLLGISAVPTVLYDRYELAVIPFIYITSVTVISRGEVSGGEKSWLYAGVVGYLSAISLLALCIYLFSQHLLVSTILLLLFMLNIGYPLVRALARRQPEFIGLAVKHGVLSLIIMDAILAAIYSNNLFSFLILGLYPATIYTAHYFNVT